MPAVWDNGGGGKMYTVYDDLRHPIWRSVTWDVHFPWKQIPSALGQSSRCSKAAGVEASRKYILVSNLVHDSLFYKSFGSKWCLWTW